MIIAYYSYEGKIITSPKPFEHLNFGKDPQFLGDHPGNEVQTGRVDPEGW